MEMLRRVWELQRANCRYRRHCLRAGILVGSLSACTGDLRLEEGLPGLLSQLLGFRKWGGEARKTGGGELMGLKGGNEDLTRPVPRSLIIRWRVLKAR